MKKARERFLIEKFRSAFVEFPEGDLVDDEPPDFIVAGASGHRTGLELTDYYNPGARERFHPAQRRAEASILNHVSRNARSPHNRTAIVSIQFLDEVPIRKNEIPEIAERVSARLNELYSGDSERANADSLPSAIESVSLTRLEGHQGLQPVHTSAYWPGPIDEQEIARIILKKEAKLPTYRQKTDEMWLVIFIDCNEPACGTLYPSSFATRFRTSFDRIFLLYDQIASIELPTEDAWTATPNR